MVTAPAVPQQDGQGPVVRKAKQEGPQAIQDQSAPNAKRRLDAPEPNEKGRPEARFQQPANLQQQRRPEAVQRQVQPRPRPGLQRQQALARARAERDRLYEQELAQIAFVEATTLCADITHDIAERKRRIINPAAKSIEERDFASYYQYRLYKVRGVVARFDPGPGGYVLHLVTGPGLQSQLACYFRLDQTQALSQIQTLQKVSLSGRCVGLNLYSNEIRLQNCRIEPD
jgi:hypothetical protein